MNARIYLLFTLNPGCNDIQRITKPPVGRGHRIANTITRLKAVHMYVRKCLTLHATCCTKVLFVVAIGIWSRC
ncbi:uncharacterized protein BDW47DRAFT_111214 [Aspergillus candidus]|uniref:Uncharacterized protein n=1 Tax=Aspergillus candidus TaxID=41067 RepID=A0A2I2F302_ASPCN|nr:hypothetical protein BDW47DRAFT_111214 [Aspergillus candidus]PLB34989.1 hypothetical protein BDW47DRAFT_111214 [Aspergillus candidus]